MAKDRNGMGHKKWVVPDTYTSEDHWDYGIPSHETLCFTNTGEGEAHLKIHILYEDDREPMLIDSVSVKSMRSMHLRLDWSDKLGGQKIQKAIPYSIVIGSDVNIVVMYSRLNWICGHATTFAVMGYYED